MGIFVIGVTVAYRIQRPERQLPILNPSDLNPALVADSLEGQGMDHRVADFDLVDQAGTRRTARDVKGKVRVVSYFFTTCPSICVDMAAYARECGCEVAGDEIQACQEAFAQPTEAQAQQCLTSSDPEQLREWWTCEDLLENYSSCAN